MRSGWSRALLPLLLIATLAGASARPARAAGAELTPTTRSAGLIDAARSIRPAWSDRVEGAGLGPASDPSSTAPDHGPHDAELDARRLEAAAGGVWAGAWPLPPARALPQPASNTATPRIQLPTRPASPAPSTGAAPGTPGGASSATPTLSRVVITPSGPRETPGDDPDPSASPRATTGPGGPDSGPSDGDPGAEDAGGRPDASGSGPNGEGDGAADASDAASPAGGDRRPEGVAPATGGGDPDPNAGSDLPRGWIGPPPADPNLARQWSRESDPRAGQTLADRLAAGRAGPWRFAPVYPLVLLLFLAAAWRAWRSLAWRAGAEPGGPAGPRPGGPDGPDALRSGAPRSRAPRSSNPRSGGPSGRALALLSTAVLGGLAACGGGELPTPEPTAVLSPTAVPSPEPLARTELPIGVQVFEDDVTTPALEHLRGAGVAWARTRALWKLVEAERRDPPVYDWSVTDWLFGDTTAAGFRNLAVVYANPDWVTERECLPVPDEHLDRYAAFWTALVERYDGDGREDADSGAVVGYWQVGNEPDFDPTIEGDESDYGSCFGHDPPRYAEQLVVAHRAIRQADPEAQVGFGPLAWDRFTAESAPEGWTASPGPFVADFTQRALEHLYRQHAGDPALPFFDFIGLHNYNDNAHFWDGAQPPLERELVGRLASFRAEQLALPGVYDLRTTPILISETGLPAGPSDDFTERSEAWQAVYVGQTMVRAQAAGALAAIWYTARDNLYGDCLPPHYDWLGFGLMRSDDVQRELEARCPGQEWLGAYSAGPAGAEPRPSLAALATLTTALRGYSFEAQLDLEATGDPSIEAYRFRGPEGRTLVAAWAGTGARLGRRGDERATATLRLDAAQLAPWTGRVRATEHLGREAVLGQPGTDSVEVLINQAPVYLTSQSD